MKCSSVGIPAPMVELCTQQSTLFQTNDSKKIKYDKLLTGVRGEREGRVGVGWVRCVGCVRGGAR